MPWANAVIHVLWPALQNNKRFSKCSLGKAWRRTILSRRRRTRVRESTCGSKTVFCSSLATGQPASKSSIGLCPFVAAIELRALIFVYGACRTFMVRRFVIVKAGGSKRSGTREATRILVANTTGGSCTAKLDSLAPFTWRLTLLALSQRLRFCTCTRADLLSTLFDGETCTVGAASVGTAPPTPPESRAMVALRSRAPRCRRAALSCSFGVDLKRRGTDLTASMLLPLLDAVAPDTVSRELVFLQHVRSQQGRVTRSSKVRD